MYYDILLKTLSLGRLYFDHILLSLFTFIWFIRYNHLEGVEGLELNFHSIFYHLVALVSANVFILILRQLTSFSSRLRTNVFCFFSFCYVLVYSYHYHTKAFLDFSTLYTNYKLAFSEYSLDIITSQIGVDNIAVACAVFIVSYLLEKRFLVLTYNRNKISKKTFFLFIIWVCYSISPLPNYDEISYFFKTIYRYSANESLISIPQGSYPLMNQGVSTPVASKDELSTAPSVVIIEIESFNARFVSNVNKSGIEYMPFFNKLISQGVYVENFFGNSVQTARGQFAILSGILPSYKSKFFDKYLLNNLNALPKILSEYGIETTYMQASGSLSFDNTGDAMKRLGFENVTTAYKFITRPKDSWHNYQMPDAQFYKAFFNYIDQRKDTRPFFALLPTIMSHSKFKTPPSDRAFYPKPKSKFEAYANCIRVVDDGLKFFFKELDLRPALKKNLVVIITGDHSYPVGIKGITANEAGYWKESFQTPFLMVNAERIKPRCIKAHAYSQIDIAPTVLDLFDIKNIQHHFSGSSLLQDQTNKPVLMTQPYRGRYFSSIRWPYRYIYHEATSSEQLFDLQRDPFEETNLLTETSEDLLGTFRKDIQKIYFNQQAIMKNAIWPSL